MIMWNLFHDIPTGSDDNNEINIIIEIPKGSTAKYEFDHKTGAIWLDRIGKTPLPYNFNYGDIPQTWNEGDDDPLDAIVLCSVALQPGVIVPCRVVGGLKMVDGGEEDYKVVCVPDDKYYEHVQDIDDVHEKEKEDIWYYMLHYKDLHGKKIDLNGWDSKENAKKVIAESKDYYKVKFSK